MKGLRKAPIYNLYYLQLFFVGVIRIQLRIVLRGLYSECKLNQEVKMKNISPSTQNKLEFPFKLFALTLNAISKAN